MATVNGREKPKKYCPNCGDRVSRSATKCLHCGRRILTRRQLIIYILIAVFIVAAFFLWLDYTNFEFFK